MGLDERSLEALEYTVILKRLKSKTTTCLGAELASSLQPFWSLEEAVLAQRETSEACRLLAGGTPPSLDGLPDIRPYIRRATGGGVLEAEELHGVLRTMVTGRELRRYVYEGRGGCHLLVQQACSIAVPMELEVELARCLAPDGTLKDEASPELGRIRREKRIATERLRLVLEDYARSAARYLQDGFITLREGRYVLPVKQEHRGQVPGIIHDQSASGATLFIEPLPAVELNNRLRKLELDERDEMRRVLGRLSGMVAGQAEALSRSYDAMGRLDFAFAKARLSLEMGGAEPLLNTEGIIELKGARHPLLKGDVVPVDLSLGKGFRVLLITGPNTGGKTVTLKTAGLLTLMGQAGLHVPALPGSLLGVFPKVFCDAGDEQSIEQSLSTFSSHMRNIVKIVDEADANSLVLLDELGAGTDPSEGAAIGMAVLDYLLDVGARAIVTTHYRELKSYAYAREGVENASVEFDVETLRPTFRLVIGLPGRSNAFEISARLGLKDSVLERARQYLTGQEVQMEKVIKALEADRAAAERAKHEAEAARREAERFSEVVRAELDELRARERAHLLEAREKARQVLAGAKREYKALLAELRDLRSRLPGRDFDRALGEIGARMGEMEREVLRATDPGEDVLHEARPPARVFPGQTVYSRSLRQKGVVLEGPDEAGKVLVRVGNILKVQLDAADLLEADGADEGGALDTNAARIAASKTRTISSEISLRGLTSDEAIALAEKYLDDACLAGLREVRIIHGKGSGTLRKAVAEWLEVHPRVRSFRLADPAEGGAGVTVVSLDI